MHEDKQGEGEKGGELSGKRREREQIRAQGEKRRGEMRESADRREYIHIYKYI